jgi:hypothetical protein
MTKKILVFETVGATYRFVAFNIVRIFIVSALPFALIAVVESIADRVLIPIQLAAMDTGHTVSPVVLVGALVRECITGMLIALAAAALHRMILFGDRSAGLRLGPIETKFMLTSLLFGLTLGILQAAQSYFLAGQLERPGSPVMAAGFLFNILYLVAAVFSVRFLQMFPIVVAEGRIDPARSWTLTSGNWWNIVGTYFFAYLPLFAIVVVSIFIEGVPDTSPAAIRANLEAGLQFDPVGLAIGFVVGIISTAIGVGLLSFGYKQLNGQGFHAVLTEDPAGNAPQ